MLTKEQIEKKYPGKKLEDIKILNFYGNEFSNIDIISQMKSLKIISLSSNKISSLKPFRDLPNLKELILRNNIIENVDEIDNLKKCDKLNSLWLEENPVCKKEEYKTYLVKTLPKLKKLDNTDVKEIIEEIEKKEKNKEDKKMKTNTSNEDKLEDLLLDYEKEQKIDTNEENKNNKDNNKNILLGSKSDIFKSEFINKEESKNSDKETNNKEKDSQTKENTEVNENNNINNINNISESNQESKSSLGFSKIQMGSLAKEPNHDLLNDILRNVDTSQSFINKNNLNQANPQPSNLNNLNTNINPAEQKNKIINSNLTKNLNDLIKEAKLDTNNTNNIEIPMNQTKNNDIEVKKILDNVDTSQTILNKKDKEIKNILMDVQSSNSNLNEIDLNNDKHTNNIQSIDDIKKMFNDDYKPDNLININMSNLYGNNIRDTQINNIFKSEMISNDSFTRNNSSKQNGPYKPDFNIPSHMQNYNYYGYENKNNINNNYKRRRNYNIKPSHENKIRAITNLLEDLNLENLLLVKNQIINKLNGQK